MKCSILVLHWPEIGTIVYLVTVWNVYYWLVIGWPRVRLALRENGDQKGGEAEPKVIYSSSFSEIYDATVVFGLNGQPGSLIFAALITCPDSQNV